MKKKKAIIFTTRNPFRANGGDKVRLLNHLEYYKKNNFDVDLVIIGFEKKNNQNLFYNFNKVINIKPSLIIFLKNIITKKKLPLQLSLYFQESIRKKIRQKFKNYLFDESIFHLVRTAGYHDCISSNLKKFEMTDSISLAYSRASKYKIIPSILKCIYNFEKKRLINFERSVINNFNVTYLISNFDKKFITKKNNNILDIKVTKNNSKEAIIKNLYNKKSQNLLFIGNFKSLSNKFASIELIKLINDFNKKYNRQLKIIFCGNAGFFEKYYFNLKNNSQWISWEELQKGEIFFTLGICNNKIISGYQNKIRDYLNLNLPSLIYYKSFFSLSENEKLKVEKYYNNRDFLNKLLKKTINNNVI